MELNTYELAASREISEWQEAQGRSSSNPLAVANRWVGGNVSKALELPGVRNAVNALDPVFAAGFGGVARTVSVPNVVAEFERHGVKTLSDIASVSLEYPDEAVKNFAAFYTAMAAGEGGVFNGAALIPGVGNLVALGLVGADVVAVTGVAMRMVCDYAAHYGFDPRDEREQLFMQGVFGLSGAVNGAEKLALIRELRTISIEIAKRATWQQLRQHTAVRVFERAAKEAGTKLVKRQLAVVVPVAGAGLGVAANAWFINQLSENARQAYRRRFLDSKQDTATVIDV